MSIPEIIIVVCLVVLALAHSALGESAILQPLFAAEWSVSETPRWAMEKILRFAWHLTSFAWLALAAAVAKVDLMPVVGAMSIVSAAIIFVMLRGHLAWPLFLLAGLAALYADGVLTGSAFQATSVATAAVLVAAALLHVYWALGGVWMIDKALPEVEGSDFSPGPALTLIVAGALATFAALVLLSSFGGELTAVRWLTIAGIAVLALRAIGDNKVAGFTKQDHSSDFGRADDQYFTPLIVFLALGATGALLV